MQKNSRKVSINLFSGLSAVFVILAILSVVGEPDLLDQIIAMAKAYSETIKCR